MIKIMKSRLIRTFSPLLLMAAVIVLTIWSSGCGWMDDTMDLLYAPALLSVYPAEGDSLVPAETTCYLVFDGPMDRSSCERNFHLYHGEDNHADSLLDGRFHWSAGSDTIRITRSTSTTV